MILFKPEWPKTSKLDMPDTSLEELIQFIGEFITLVIIGDPDFSESDIQRANMLCEAIDAHPQQRVLLVDDEEVLLVLKPQLESMVSNFDIPFEEVRAFTVPLGSIVPTMVISKSDYGLFTIKEAYQKAILQLS